MTKTLLIIRGVSGCGKTTLANLLAGQDNVATADDYFYKLGKERTGNEGVYDFDASKLWLAHKSCAAKVKKLMKADTPIIAVANTSTRNSDVKVYQDIAKEFGYTSFVIVVENRHGGKDAHNVPEENLAKMATQLFSSIQLR